MQNTPMPVTLGSPRYHACETESFRVVEAWFPPGAILDPHTHDRPLFSMMIRGGFQTEIATRWLECEAGVAWTEPNSEKHANYVGRAGAHVVIIQADDTRDELMEPLRELLEQVHLLNDPALLCSAPRIRAELRAPDATSALAIEDLATAALSLANRLQHRDGDGHRAPQWLGRVRELLHEEWRDSLTLSYVASVAGVHPCHLAHTFRERIGESIGTYLQRLRVTWALSELTASDRPISQLALEAGFCDQSHFTRQCLRFAGVTPAAFRASIAGRARRHQRARSRTTLSSLGWAQCNSTGM